MADMVQSPRLLPRSIISVAGLALAISAVVMQVVAPRRVGGEWGDLPVTGAFLTYASITAIGFAFLARSGARRSSHRAARPLFYICLVGGICGALWFLFLTVLLIRIFVGH